MSKNIDIKKVFWIYLFAFLLAAFSFRADAKTTETSADKVAETVEKQADTATEKPAKKAK